MKRFLTTIAALCLATASHAATIDFAAEADNNGERGVTDGTTINSAETDNLNVTLSATGNDKAYLDAGNAGLGVCGSLTDPGAQCNPSSDDNLQSGEEVNVKIDDGQGNDSGKVDGIVFRGANHALLDEEEVMISFDGGVTYDTYTTDENGFVDLSDPEDGNFTSAGISFKTADGGSEFYVSQIGSTDGPGVTVVVNPVPLPAGMLLLLSGVGGLTALRLFRRRGTVA